MTRRLFLFTLVTVLAIVLLAAPSGCGYPKHIDPPLYTFETQRLAQLSAEAYAKSVGGKVYSVADTHSMEPVIKGGDWIVIAPLPFQDRKPGEIITYVPTWRPGDQTATHRISLIDKDGLLVEGDNVDGEHPENKWRVTATNYRGVVVAIYRFKP